MAPLGLLRSVQLGAEEFAGCDIGGCGRGLPSKLPDNGGPTAGAADASRGAKHRSRRARTLRVIILGHVVEETDGESVNLDTGKAGHHTWSIGKPATSLRGGPGGASRRTGRNESKVGVPACVRSLRGFCRMNGNDAIRCLYVACSFETRQGQ